MLFSIAVPANAAPSNIRPRASMSFGLLKTRGRLGTVSLNDSCENISDRLLRLVVTAVFNATKDASMMGLAMVTEAWGTYKPRALMTPCAGPLGCGLAS